MVFPRYYDSEYFKAEKMHTRAAIAITNPDYIPPPDIQLYYLLEIIGDFAALGQTQLDLRNLKLDNNIFNKLYELGYVIETNNNNTTIRWNWRT